MKQKSNFKCIIHFKQNRNETKQKKIIKKNGTICHYNICKNTKQTKQQTLIFRLSIQLKNEGCQTRFFLKKVLYRLQKKHNPEHLKVKELKNTL